MKKYVVLVILCAVVIWSVFNTRATSVESEGSMPFDEAQIELPEAVTTAASDSNRELSQNQNGSQEKIAVLKEIFKSKNDNDPRIDTLFRNLSVEDKDALVKMYQTMSPESLNDKGTIVFLIGREMTRPEDAEFLKSVLSEEPCLSLENCGVTNSQRDPHLDSVNDVTLNYPQVVALNRIKTFVENQNLQNVNPSVLSHLMDAVQVGESSKIPMVQSRSKEISNLLNRK